MSYDSSIFLNGKIDMQIHYLPDRYIYNWAHVLLRMIENHLSIREYIATTKGASMIFSPNWQIGVRSTHKHAHGETDFRDKICGYLYYLATRMWTSFHIIDFWCFHLEPLLLQHADILDNCVLQSFWQQLGQDPFCFNMIVPMPDS